MNHRLPYPSKRQKMHAWLKQTTVVLAGFRTIFNVCGAMNGMNPTQQN
jgi:hypothetical protein